MSNLFTTSRGSLETKLFAPSDGTVKPTKLAVFTHAWTFLGGSMHDSILEVLRPLFLSRGFHVLLYHARSSLTGVEEAQDLKELVQGILNQPDAKYDRVILLGYSHGALITSLHPLLAAPFKTSHILLSYPMGVRGLITFFHGATYDEALHALVRNSRSDVLILYGDRDWFTSLYRYELWVSRLRKHAKGGLNAVRIGEGDHLWSQEGGGEELCLVVGRWLDEQLGPNLT